MLTLVLLATVTVAAYSKINPPVTALMLRDWAHGHHVDRRWQPLSRISPALVRAVIGAEDARFCLHHGFDWSAIETAARRNAEGGRLRGGSTISQQTAKNVFLWPGRTYVRKALEAAFTWAIEAVWGKRRIMEVYLNVIEFGPGIYGAEAASERFFGVPAARLTSAQSARLAAVLPQPIVRDAARPGRAVRRYAGRIGRRIGTVRADALDWCISR